MSWLRRIQRRALTAASDAAPGWFWRRYADRARALGIDALYLVLSFDCDTPDDAAAAEVVFDRLDPLGIGVTLAVPGELLRASAPTYRRLAERGARFMNHGALPHAALRDGRYWSITFYAQMTPAEVARDIEEGDRIVREVIGPPKGFRAPHFGLFQGSEQLSLIHRVCGSLGYSYASTTVPSFAFRRGPIASVDGLVEVPVSGTSRHPLTILDSWGHLSSPYDLELLPAYGSKLRATVDDLLKLGIPGVLNYYVDPVHVHGSEVFYSALEHALARGLRPLLLEDVPSLAGLVPA